MGWIVAAALAATTILLIALYRRACSETTQVSALLILVLLDVEVHESQKAGLLKFVGTTQPRNALELSAKVHASVRQLAANLAPTSVLGVHSLLWKFRRDASAGQPHTA